jgi:electron transport complex protein RnfC
MGTTIDRSDTLRKRVPFVLERNRRKNCRGGIVGMGGATFPTHVKLTPPPGLKANILIINGVECEPYLTSDHELMLEKAEEIFVGTEILMKAIDVKKAVIGIENNKKDAIARFAEISKSYPGIEVQPLKVKYPQGGEKQLIEAITGRQVPSGALPISVEP